MPRKRTPEEIEERAAQGDKLRELAFARGYSIGEIAAHLGVSEGTVYAIHRGESWNPGHIHNYREWLQMTDPGPVEHPQSEVDAWAEAWWRDLDDWIVKAQLIVLGRHLLENFDSTEARTAEIDQLAEWLRSRKPNG